jgi:tRNA(Ile2)-agmatinylcytidine synthase
MVEDPETNPGIIFYTGKIDQKLHDYALKTIQKIVTLKQAEKLAAEIGAEVHKYKNGRGVIGALAAIGCYLEDKTYELIAYRDPQNYGTKRAVNEDSVRFMNKITYPNTFDNVDDGYIAITPHTPCPVLYGIRGETKEDVEKAHQIVEVTEPIEREMIFVSNQHTDQHIQQASEIKQLKKYQCYKVEGRVKDYPHIIEGGHVIFTLQDQTGTIECAAYEPTKSFRDIIRQLLPDDRIMVWGGMGKKGTLNLEKIKILHLETAYKILNPQCACGKRMKSAGKNKGYKCPSCGLKAFDLEKEKNEIDRSLQLGFYEVPPSARRHLSKPIVRM